MTVTELAILPLTHSLTRESPTIPSSVIQKLQAAKVVLKKSSGHSFYYFQQIEDPSIIYILGAWDSTAAHGAFLPSPENQELLELFKDDIVMQGEGEMKMSMWHLDSNIFLTSSEEKSVLTAPTIALGRHFVTSSEKGNFGTKFSEVRGLLGDFTKPYKLVGGWRIEKEAEDKEEWVLFSGFKSVNHHMTFTKTVEFEKYKEIMGCVEGFEVTHMRMIEAL